jgi:hypothetical protein
MRRAAWQVGRSGDVTERPFDTASAEALNDLERARHGALGIGEPRWRVVTRVFASHRDLLI